MSCGNFCKGKVSPLNDCIYDGEDHPLTETACHTDRRRMAFPVYESSDAMSRNTVGNNVCHKTHKSNVSLRGCVRHGHMQNALSCRPYRSIHTRKAFLCLSYKKRVDSQAALHQVADLKTVWTLLDQEMKRICHRY